MFVAESTGGVGSFVVPALVAAAVSQLVAGPSSVADHQHQHRLGYLERRFTLPLSSILSTDVLTVPPDATSASSCTSTSLPGGNASFRSSMVARMSGWLASTTSVNSNATSGRT